jgi:predicted nucleic acid-binding protein
VIVIDTSVWINALRTASSREAEVVGRLLDEDEAALAVPVKVEILSGASESDRPRLRRALSALPVLYPSDETWRLIDTWIDTAGASREQFGLGDYLIAALARGSGSLLWSLDADFQRMARLGFVDPYDP